MFLIEYFSLSVQIRSNGRSHCFTMALVPVRSTGPHRWGRRKDQAAVVVFWQFLCENGDAHGASSAFSQRFRGGLLKFTEVADLAFRINEDQPTAGIRQDIVRTIRAYVKKHTTLERGASETECSLMHVPMVLREFCCIDIEKQDVDHLYESFCRRFPDLRSCSTDASGCGGLQFVLDRDEEDETACQALVARTECARKAEMMTKEELVNAFVDLSVAHAKKDAKLVAVQQQRRRLAERNETLENEVDQLRSAMGVVVQETVLRPGLRNVCLRGKYNLALLRTCGQTSASTALSMIGSSGWAGDLKDYHVITKQEHIAAACIRRRSKEAHQSNDSSLVAAGDLQDLGPMPPKLIALDIILFKGDATHQEACEKKKMYLSMMWSWWCSFDAMLSILSFAAKTHTEAPHSEHLPTQEQRECDRKTMRQLCEGIGAHVVFGKACPAMQSVAQGTSQELYRLIWGCFSKRWCVLVGR